MTSLAKCLAAGALVVVAAIAQPARAEDAAKLFADSCAACHTVGGGDLAGPDLTRATKFSRHELHEAVERMKDNAGPLTEEQIELLVDLLKSPDVKTKLAAPAAPAAPPVIQLTPEQKAARAPIGRALFFGEQRLANGGTPCFACHSINGRGGNLARDLTNVYAMRGEAAVVLQTKQPAFPFMKAAYATHAITPQEAYHLAAFFRDVPPNAVPLAESTTGVQGTAAGLAVVVFAAVAFASRRRSPRAELKRKSPGGEV